MIPFPVGETLVAGAIGLGDGAISANDAQAGRVDFQHQHATWLTAGVGVAGVLGSFVARRYKNVTDPMVTTSAALLLRRLAFSQVMKGATTPVAAYGHAAPRVAVAAPVANIAPAASRPMPFLKQSTVPNI